MAHNPQNPEEFPHLKVVEIILTNSALWTTALEHFNTQPDSKKRSIFLLFESVFFFCHIAHRIAAHKLKKQSATFLDQLIKTNVALRLVEMLIESTDEEYLNKMRISLFESINNADHEYAETMKAENDQENEQDYSLLIKLAGNIAQTLAVEGEKAEIIYKAVAQMYKKFLVDEYTPFTDALLAAGEKTPV